jgi:AbrB family looped-hinge helix DNA binding protein
MVEKTFLREATNVRATGIVRRIDELGRVVIPKEIRRTLRIREGDPSQITGKEWERFCFAMSDLAKRAGW